MPLSIGVSTDLVGVGTAVGIGTVVGTMAAGNLTVELTKSDVVSSNIDLSENKSPDM